MREVLGQCFAQVDLLRSESLTVVIQDIRVGLTQVAFTVRVRKRSRSADTDATLSVACAGIVEAVPLATEADATYRTTPLTLPAPPIRQSPLSPVGVVVFQYGSDQAYLFAPRGKGQALAFELAFVERGVVGVGIVDDGVLDEAVYRRVA